jgi:hypothetical protein
MLTDRAMNSRNGTPYVFPLYRYCQGVRHHNLNARYVQELERSTGMKFIEGDAHVYAGNVKRLFQQMTESVHA